MTPWSLATMAVAPITARLIERFHPGRTASFGMVLYAFGILMLLILPEGRCEEWQIVWRMTICGIGFGLFQTPNNVVMVMATPLKRSGSAGGMQSTARLTGQTLGATLVTLLFALTNVDCSIQFCLITAMAFALTAAALSLLRKIEQKSIAG